MIVSYIDKKTSGMKNMMILMPMHEKVKVTNKQSRKPRVHVMFDHTKGGIDNNAFNTYKVQTMAYQYFGICAGDCKNQWESDFKGQRGH